MPGKSVEAIPWPIVYGVLLDDTVEPVRKAQVAWTSARDAGQSTRSRAMFGRYMAAAWVAQQYHGNGRLDLRRIDAGTWHRLEMEVRADLAGSSAASRRLNLTDDALMERITPRMVEKAVAGWHAVQEEQPGTDRPGPVTAAPVVAAAPTAPRRSSFRRAALAVSLALALLVLGVGLGVGVGVWRVPFAPKPATAVPSPAEPAVASPGAHPVPPGPPPPLLVQGVVRLTPAAIVPGTPAAVTAEIVRPEFAAEEALKLQLNIYRMPPGVVSLHELVTGEGVTFLFERFGVNGPRGMMNQAVFRPFRFEADGKTFISFTLNLPEDPGKVDYILNAGTETDTNRYQALLPIHPAPAGTAPARLSQGQR